ncbi:MAG: hypothetical protein H0W58_08010 [Acidobacteria bacterium]|jgi:hypothetical protein|nr:hypothetical protein [Acidobacteriota bacterium]
MTDNEYLKKVLEQQTLDPDGDEMKKLRLRRDDAESRLRKKFGSGPSIRYGGSKAKGTMIKEAYDLDVICYFDNDDTSAGDTLQEIYDSVADVFKDDYLIERKPSAIRLKSKNSDNWAEDYHTDIVLGRFVDEDRDDVFLYRSSGEKGRQKTNLDVHINHIKTSGVQDAIRLEKLWRKRNILSIRHFILELLAIDLLKGKKNLPLTEQLIHFWTEVRDNVEDMTVEDPANPYGNDLSELFNATVKYELSSAARTTLDTIEKDGWKKVFGELPEEEKTNNCYPRIWLPGRDVNPSPSFGE